MSAHCLGGIIGEHYDLQIVCKHRHTDKNTSYIIGSPELEKTKNNDGESTYLAFDNSHKTEIKTLLIDEDRPRRW